MSGKEHAFIWEADASEAVFKVGMCPPAPYVSDDDVQYIVDTIKSAIVG